MNIPRFSMPWRRNRRTGRHHDTARPTTRTRGTAGAAGSARSRHAVGGAMALLAATAMTATAATGGAGDVEPATAAEPASVEEVVEIPADEPTVVVSQDEKAVRASSALQRALTVVAEQASLSPAQEKKIDRQVDKISDILDDRDTDTASRSGERSALPEAATDGSSPADASGEEILAANHAAAAEAAQEDAVEKAAQQSAAQADETSGEKTGETAEKAATDGSAATEDATTQDATTQDAVTEDADETVEVELTTAESTALAKATDKLVALLDAAESDQLDVEAAPEEPTTPKDITAAQVQAAKEAAAKLKKYVKSVEGYGNGQIPQDDLCELDFAAGEMLRCDAAEQLERLDVAYTAKFGEHLFINDSYRSFASQVAVKASRGSMAAVPGYSNHGWGVAVDLNGGVESFGTAQYEWLRENGPKFGWDNPGWARADGRKPEAWHWEYTPLG